MNPKLSNSIKEWKNKLLDITLRNRSINFPLFKKTSTIPSHLRVLVSDFKNFLNDSIGRNLEFANVDMGESLNDNEYNSKVFKSFTLEELQAKVKNINKKTIFSEFSFKHQLAVLGQIFRKSTLFKEENAINPLNLAIGFVKWYENINSDDFHFAPLFLISTDLSHEKNIYKLSFSDDAIITLNESLVQKLKIDFNIDINIPEEEYEDNYAMYSSYKEKIIDQFLDKRWEIIDVIELSNFSFSKISIYKDIEENIDKIEENSFYKMLFSEGNVNQNSLNINEDNVEKYIDHNKYYHVLSSDSSQEVAIESAINGESFVLQGPPGTGKSQTITNIITELLARGKKILFVAEKKAALDVVYNKLKQIELEDYTIPIHNSSIDKKMILKDLFETLEKGRSKFTITNEDIILNQYATNRDFLNKYGKELLKVINPINKNAYQLIGYFLKYENKMDLPFQIANINSIDELKLNDLNNKINSYFQTMKLLNFNPAENPWYGIKNTNLTIEEKEIIFKNVEKLLNKFNNLLDKFKLISSINIKENSIIKGFEEIIKLIDAIQEINFINPKIEEAQAIINDLNIYKKLSDMKKNIDYFEKELFSKYKNKIMDEDLDFIKNSLLEVKDKIFKSFNKNFRSAKKIFKNFSLIKKLKYINYLDDISKAIDLKNQYKNFNNFENQILTKIHTSTNVDDLNNAIKQYELINLLEIIIKDFDIEIDKKLLFNSINNSKDFKEKINNLKLEIEEFLNINKEIMDLLQNDNTTFTINDFTSKIENLNNNPMLIDSMLSLNRELKILENEGLQDFTNRIESERVKNNYFEIFLKRFYKLLVDKCLINNFGNYSANILNNYRNSFKEYDDKIHQLAKIKIDSNLKLQIPNIDGILGENTEIKILKSQINKTRNIMPFRLLFQKIPNLITKLKPCLMMSPLSVSTYLKNSDIEFDVVIFDEASQVKPENAIGAIYRAKQYIIVGDKEQLPPTNFFNSSDKDDEVYNEETDDDSTKGFDSILELADSNLKSIKLKWHYRSKFEELIQPSNDEIYKNLISFPSTKHPGKYEGISLIKIKGNYQDRKNEDEANKVIETLQKIIKKYGLKKSIGVVTFNLEQQMLIERKIDKFISNNPEFESFFDNNKHEKFFVKNIETVQGDERDIIIMSIGYGYNKLGRLSMNFGAINQSAGYRRLNVAFTRAKEAVIVVSSIGHSDIDLSKTESRGVKFLKNYLRIAEFGKDSKEDYRNDNSEFDSVFEGSVYDEIVRLGYKAVTQLGSSGYRIDLAIVHPDNSNAYTLAIECDGASYHSSKTARDRDKLRQEILELRGWHFYRIWSTDWFKNKALEIKKLKSAIDESFKNFAKEKQLKPNVKTDIELDVNFETIDDNITDIEFPEFPDLTEFMQKHAPIFSNENWSDWATRLHILSKLIKIISPIHINNLRKLYLRLMKKSSMGQRLKENFDLLIFRVRNPDLDIESDNGFLIYANQPIKYRQNSELIQRNYDEIHNKEYEDMILKFVETVEKSSKNAILKFLSRKLKTSISNLYSKVDEILSPLIKAGKIEEREHGSVITIKKIILNKTWLFLTTTT
ncbi:putative DNA helicase related protein [[Mycoplasma] phocae]|uniref:Putative DNA helicase related protein n=1 Tax=[Mycoplasma] phocae TaxID=142651 RepID=A0A2Z5IPQ8_9BACT|nr:AAA domain-containing protein [[Mycoplasma] phocae]AXE60713.1 putative DNA helicase related protein [[Mycoplasma] phocae]